MTATRDVFLFNSTQRVHYDMLDLTGALHNAQFLLLFERARTDFWHGHSRGPGSPELDWPFVVVRNEIDYLQPITRDQSVTVGCAVTEIASSSVRFAHDVADDQTVFARGAAVLVLLDARTGRSRPWSDHTRDLFQSIMA